MGMYVRKAITGYRQVPQEEATHYIEDLQEHTQICREHKELSKKLQAAEENIRHLKSEHKTEILRQEELIRIEYETQVQNLNAKITDLSSQLTVCIQGLAEEKAKNTNLVRILRERANAIRGIRPKKKHDGYIITSCRQHRDYREIRHSWEDYQKKPSSYRKKHRYAPIERLPVMAWKLTVLSPCQVGLPVKQVEQLVFSEMRDGILKEIGCDKVSDSNGTYPATSEGQCILYRWDLSADIKTGLWAVEIYITGQPCIPRERLLIQPAALSLDTNDPAGKE